MIEHGRIKPFRLTEILRQKDAGYRAAAQLLSEGKAAEGFDALDKLGWVTGNRPCRGPLHAHGGRLRAGRPGRRGMERRAGGGPDAPRGRASSPAKSAASSARPASSAARNANSPAWCRSRRRKPSGGWHRPTGRRRHPVPPELPRAASSRAQRMVVTDPAKVPVEQPANSPSTGPRKSTWRRAT